MMYVDFIASLIILCFAFRLILILIGPLLKIVFMAVFTPFTRGRVDRAGYYAALVHPIILSALYGSFIALVTVVFALSTGSTGRAVYTVIGAVTALFSLLSYSAGLLAKIGSRFLGGPDEAEDRAYRIAAIVSFLVGLAAFPASYFYPRQIMAVPGVETFFEWVFKLALWLSGFKVVEIIIALAILGYIVIVSAKVFYGLILMAVGWLKGLIFRPRID